MEATKVLEVVLREMTAYGRGWRASWIDFDGRTLRAQLNGVEEWAQAALKGERTREYYEGSAFEYSQEHEWDNPPAPSFEYPPDSEVGNILAGDAP